MKQLFGYKIITSDVSPSSNMIKPDFHSSITYDSKNSYLFIGDIASNEKKKSLSDTPELLIVVDGNLYLKKDFYAKYHQSENIDSADLIAALYKHFGIGIVNDLTGDFIIVINDKKNGRFFIVRDKMGGRKLYYTVAHGATIFSSTIRSLLNLPGISRDINFFALESFLKFGYIIAPDTIFNSIKELGPGQFMEITDNAHDIISYWSLQTGTESEDSNQVIIDHLYDSIRENIAIRIKPQEKIGAFLSGGIDSNTILAFLAQMRNPADIATISVGYGAQYNDYHELNQANFSAHHFGSNHHELVFGPEQVDQYLCRTVWEFEQPFGNPALISWVALSEFTHNHADVIFVGTGGDEVLGGYRRYNALTFLKSYYKIPFYSHITAFARYALQILSTGANHYSIFYRLHKFFDGIESDILKTNEVFLFGKYTDLRNTIFLPGLLDKCNAEMPALDVYYQIDSTAADFKKIFIADCYTDLVSEQLTRSLVPLRYYGIDYRAPLSDPDFMQMCLTIPDKYKFNTFNTKIAYKAAVAKLLPPFILKQKKRGMSHPVGLWLQGPLFSLLTQVLSSNNAALNQYFQMDTLQALAGEHFNGKRDWGNLLWKMMVFSMWHKLFVEEKYATVPDVRLSNLYRHAD